MVNSEVWYEVVLVMLVHIGLKLLVSGSLGLQAFWEVGTVASWNRLLLSKLSTGLLEVVLGGDNIMINTEVWYKVVFVVLVHISLKLLVSGGLCLEAFWEVSTVASWDGCLLSQFTSSLLEVILGGDNIVINSEVWNKVILIVFVHIGLELLVSSSFGLQAFWEVS